MRPGHKLIEAVEVWRGNIMAVFGDTLLCYTDSLPNPIWVCLYSVLYYGCQPMWHHVVALICTFTRAVGEDAG